MEFSEEQTFNLAFEPEIQESDSKMEHRFLTLATNVMYFVDQGGITRYVNFACHLGST